MQFCQIFFFKKAGTASRSSPSKGVRFLSDAGSGADNKRNRLLDLGTSYNFYNRV